MGEIIELISLIWTSQNIFLVSNTACVLIDNHLSQETLSKQEPPFLIGTNIFIFFVVTSKLKRTTVKRLHWKPILNYPLQWVSV